MRRYGTIGGDMRRYGAAEHPQAGSGSALRGCRSAPVLSAACVRVGRNRRFWALKHKYNS